MGNVPGAGESPVMYLNIELEYLYGSKRAFKISLIVLKPIEE